MIVVAKGLGGGYQPVGAVLASGKVVEALQRGSGVFQHGHTYIGHAMGAAAALAVQQVIERDGLLAQVRERGALLRRLLGETFASHPHVGDVRGRGLFMALELVADRETKAPFDPALRLHARVKARAMANGMMVYPTGGTIDGRNGDHVLVAPPFIVSESQVGEIVARLARSIDEAIAEARAA